MRRHPWVFLFGVLLLFAGVLPAADERAKVPDADDESAEWTPEEIALGKRWVQTWAEAGVVMERLRREEIRAQDTVTALRGLAGAFESARFMGVARPSSGLVEQQRLFLRWNKNSRG